MSVSIREPQFSAQFVELDSYFIQALNLRQLTKEEAVSMLQDQRAQRTQRTRRIQRTKTTRVSSLPVPFLQVSSLFLSVVISVGGFDLFSESAQAKSFRNSEGSANRCEACLKSEHDTDLYHTVLSCLGLNECDSAEDLAFLAKYYRGRDSKTCTNRAEVIPPSAAELARGRSKETKAISVDFAANFIKKACLGEGGLVQKDVKKDLKKDLKKEKAPSKLNRKVVQESKTGIPDRGTSNRDKGSNKPNRAGGSNGSRGSHVTGDLHGSDFLWLYHPQGSASQDSRP